MDNEIKRNLGEQPIAIILRNNNLSINNIVKISLEQITHKMVTKACKGRRLTATVKLKILNALNKYTGKLFLMKELFNY